MSKNNDLNSNRGKPLIVSSLKLQILFLTSGLSGLIFWAVL
jgi:hypothetical protein